MGKRTAVFLSACAAALCLSGCAQSSRDSGGTSSTQSPRHHSRETGRAFLLKGQPEKPGYGLYSYILFGARPGPATRERYLRMLAAYVDIPEVSRLETERAACELNVTYLPLRGESPSPAPSAEWLLENYDYDRARLLLGALKGSHRGGPYIVSTYKPLGGVRELSGQFLYQDLSSTPPDIVVLWVKEFLTQVEQERFWEERTVMQCILTLRQSIAAAATGFPQVKESVDSLIAWKK